MRFTGRICFLFLICWLAITVSVSAQKPRQLVKKAEKAFFNDDLNTAISLYEQAAALKPSDPEMQFRLGYLYLLRNETARGIAALEKAVTLSPEFNPEYTLALAEQYQLSAAFEAAATQYQLLLDKTDKEEEEEVVFLKKRLQECASGKLLMARPATHVVRNPGAPLNSPTDDMVPVLTNNDATLIFVSPRAKAGTRQQNEDIFETTRTPEGWSVPRAFGKPLNTKNPDAVTYVTPDGNTFYVFVEKNNGDIAEIKRTGPDSWSKPELLDDPINTKSFEPSFFITRDNQFAFFSSDRPDGFGGLDLYLAMRQPDGSWSEAMNLGSNINTPYDEDAPFISEDGSTLYFSSRGHNSMGGYDIFRSSSAGITWAPAQNLGHPINSPANDIYFTRTADGTLGYFTSDRAGGLGEKDIYEVSFRSMQPADSLAETPAVARTDSKDLDPEPTPIIATPESGSEAVLRPGTLPLTVHGTVTDVTTRQPIPARITVAAKTGTADTIALQAGKNGKYAFTITKASPYEVIVRSDGYFFASETLNLPVSFAGDSLLRYFRLNKIKTGARLVLKNVFFEYNNHVLTQSSREELDRVAELLEENSKLKIEISGHTDSKGKAAYNEQLSLKRARAVVNYLAEQGINKNRLVAIGYGARRPVATNKTEAGRKLNRRTEFRVLTD